MKEQHVLSNAVVIISLLFCLIRIHRAGENDVKISFPGFGIAIGVVDNP